MEKYIFTTAELSKFAKHIAKMNPFFKKLALLFALLVTLLQGSIFPTYKDHVRFTNAFGSFDTVHVKLTNTLSTKVLVHCKSGDNDLGEHVLYKTNFVEWSFRPHSIVWNTKYLCTIEWQGSILTFFGYKETRDMHGCHSQCFWDIGVNGTCLLNDNGRYNFCELWPAAKSSNEVKV